MYYNDHMSPHFHALYSEYDVSIDMRTLTILEGEFPNTKLKLLLRWAKSHTDELTIDWELARQGVALNSIAPLK